MDRNGSLFPLLAGALAAATATAAHAAAPAHQLHRDHVLGTSLDLTAVGGDRDAAQAALAAAMAEIDRLEPLLSGHRTDSELSRLNAAKSAVVSPELYAVIEAAEDWRRRSGGAFDGRLGAAEALWRQAADQGVLPDRAVLTRAVWGARDAGIGLDPRTRRVERPDGAVFALDGLAKGYVIDAALAAARRAAPSLQGLMMDIGGDMAVWGEGPAGAWTVGAADPRRPQDNAAPGSVIKISGGGAATSGAGPRDLEIDGKRYGMRLSPRDGAPNGATASATVVAPCAMDADAMATALSVMDCDAGLALIEATPGAEATIFDARGRRRSSSGWILAQATTPPPVRPGAAVPTTAAWPAGFALTVDFELPRPNRTPIYSPYVSIWVTDATNRPIRQLLLQGDDYNYIDQNYLWWRRYGRGAPQMVDAMSRPTRPAGRYSALWDGRDQAGKLVGQGRYTIHIEVTREHGLHSYQAMPMELGRNPAEATAPAVEELAVSRARYGRRP